MLITRQVIPHSNRIRNGLSLKPVRDSVGDHLELAFSFALAENLQHLAPVELIPADRVQHGFPNFSRDHFPDSPPSRRSSTEHQRPLVTDSFESASLDQQSKQQL